MLRRGRSQGTGTTPVKLPRRTKGVPKRQPKEKKEGQGSLTPQSTVQHQQLHQTQQLAGARQARPNPIHVMSPQPLSSPPLQSEILGNVSKKDIELSDGESQDEGFESSTSTTSSKDTYIPAPKRFYENPVLLVLLLGFIMGMHSLFLYNRLQYNTESLLEKINHLQNLSEENSSSLFGDTQTCLETVVANCSKQMDKCKETAEMVKAMIDDETYLNNSINTLKKKVEILNTNIITINNNLSTESKRLHNLKLLLKNVQGKQGEVNEMEAKLDEAQQSVSHLEKDLLKHAEKVERYQTEFPSSSKIPARVQTLDETIKILRKNIEDIWVLVQKITVAVVITVLSLCGLLYRKGTQIGDIEKKIRYLTENKDKPSLQYESLSIVEQIKRRQPEELENKFCVISFSQETHNKHRRITRPSVEGRLRIKKMDEADFVVTNDKSVLKIPHCKVILVFVDHNQKDVILETPGEDEEDIKLLTVQACRKMGADVFVIYVGDEGSESLMAGCLYNPQLTTVAEHFELKQLEQRSRVITCREKFTITQREKVAQAIA